MAFLSYENKRGSGKKLKVHFDLPEDDEYPTSNRKNSSSSISSESSLDSDDTDKDDNSIDNVYSKYGVYGSPVWSFQGGSVTQSPPVQFMSSPAYDPSRIPSSIFANRPTSPMEWSAASNESLFSIHLGNNSFSRDNTFAFNKSGELPRTNDLVGMPSPLPPVQEVTSNCKNVDMERHSVSSNSSDETIDSVEGKDQKKTTHETEGSLVEVDHNKTQTLAEVGTIVWDKTPADHCKEERVPSEEPKNYTSVSYRSMESDISTRSFQFPILTADAERTSSSTVESEKEEKSEKQEEQQVEEPLKPTSPPITEQTPKQSGRTWCFCFSCSSCF
ncbi:uncharacterized protein LOC113867648 [Abrus precatorius]|uniref:Uncharacterized protein LOC113867648 n=1 Tax=Abrus precatorius TaxID=3816 RepID=A0A8B8LR67_ABRPR|nr:uncharacterized protein LOC113867648 [Abrus precatorius]